MQQTKIQIKKQDNDSKCLSENRFFILSHL